jgi:hypothetical protein
VIKHHKSDRIFLSFGGSLALWVIREKDCERGSSNELAEILLCLHPDTGISRSEHSGNWLSKDSVSDKFTLEDEFQPLDSKDYSFHEEAQMKMRGLSSYCISVRRK